MNARTWDHYEFRIGSHFLAAMINADTSGMSDEEAAELDAFENAAFEAARAAGFTVGHWADVTEDGEDFGRCDISGMQDMVCLVRLMVFKLKEVQA